MYLRRKGDDKAAPEQMDWHQAQAALQTGNYDIVSEGPESDGDRGPKFVADMGDKPSPEPTPVIAPVPPVKVLVQPTAPTSAPTKS